MIVDGNESPANMPSAGLLKLKVIVAGFPHGYTADHETAPVVSPVICGLIQKNPAPSSSCTHLVENPSDTLIILSRDVYAYPVVFSESVKH